MHYPAPLVVLTILSSLGVGSEVTAGSPRPIDPTAIVMLQGPSLPADSKRIDFDHLPKLPAAHVTISDVSARQGVNQHNYLTYYAGRFWAMWSDGPRREDMGGQQVKYAVSRDGLAWEAPRTLTGFPPHTGPDSRHYNTRDPEGLRYIARGFWVRDGHLLALVSRDEAAAFFGPSLTLLAFSWDESSQRWTERGTVLQDAINNFPPERLPNGTWAMICRPHDYVQKGVRFAIGGNRALDDWQLFPVVSGPAGGGLQAEEPIWYALPSGELVALFRDNAKSGFLFRSFSFDSGRTWTPVVKTNFPDARSKLAAIRLHDGRYVLVSNSNPARRDPLTLAVSRDGLTYHQLFYLTGGRQVDYPQVMEREGFLYVAYSGVKMSVELLRVLVADLGP